MKNFDIGLSLKKKKDFYSITANVKQFTMGIFIGSGSTLEDAKEDLDRKLIQTFEDRGISSQKVVFSTTVEVADEVIKAIGRSAVEKFIKNLEVGVKLSR